MFFKCLDFSNWLGELLFAHLYQENKYALLFANACCKMVLEISNVSYANKTKTSFTTQEFISCDGWHIEDSVFSKGKSDISPTFNGLKVLFPASREAKL